MSENVVENQVCRACSADVRPGALFCYSCGKSVAPELPLANDEANRNGTSTFWFREEIAKNENRVPEETKIIEKPVEELVVPATPQKANIKDKKAIVQDQAKLKTAASLRQKPRTQEIKKVEVVWEASESAPNLWFIVVSIILVLFAVGVLLAMLYIR